MTRDSVKRENRASVFVNGEHVAGKCAMHCHETRNDDEVHSPNSYDEVKAAAKKAA